MDPACLHRNEILGIFVQNSATLFYKVFLMTSKENRGKKSFKLVYSDLSGEEQKGQQPFLSSIPPFRAIIEGQKSSNWAPPYFLLLVDSPPPFSTSHQNKKQKNKTSHTSFFWASVVMTCKDGLKDKRTSKHKANDISPTLIRKVTAPNVVSLGLVLLNFFPALQIAAGVP